MYIKQDLEVALRSGVEGHSVAALSLPYSSVAYLEIGQGVDK